MTDWSTTSPAPEGLGGIYAALIGAFAAGAVLGAVLSRAWEVHAIWVAAGILAVTLVLFIVDRDALQ